MFFSNSQSAAMVALLARSIERTCARIIYSYAMRRLTAVEVGGDEDRGVPAQCGRRARLRADGDDRSLDGVVSERWLTTDKARGSATPGPP